MKLLVAAVLLTCSAFGVCKGATFTVTNLVTYPTVLYADGKHDDADALQAVFNGHEVFTSDGKKVPPCRIVGGTFLISHHIDLFPNQCGPTVAPTWINSFVCLPPSDTGTVTYDSMVRVYGGAPVSVSFNMLVRLTRKESCDPRRYGEHPIPLNTYKPSPPIPLTIEW